MGAHVNITKNQHFLKINAYNICSHVNITKNQHFCKLTLKIWVRTLTSLRINIFVN